MTIRYWRAVYRDVADASQLPVILYNMPRNAGINISAKLASNCRSTRTHRIKDSGWQLSSRIADMIRNDRRGFSVFAGSASYLYATACLGRGPEDAGFGQCLSERGVPVCQTLFEAGNMKEARDLQMDRSSTSNNSGYSQVGHPGLRPPGYDRSFTEETLGPPLMPLGNANRDELLKILTRTEILSKRA